MPTHTTSLRKDQYQYILATGDENVSERIQELIDKGMEVEEDG